MFVERANRALGGTEKSKVGILLVGHGQPDAWDKVYVTQTTQEQQFREEVMERLVADGFEREHISLAWMEFKAPEPGEKARELAEKAGVEKILVFSASISAPSLHSEYDTPEAVRAARLPPGVEVVNLGAWGDDPLVIQAIREKLRDCGL
jgi:sirohydrochlorin ferrochelatase